MNHPSRDGSRSSGVFGAGKYFLGCTLLGAVIADSTCVYWYLFQPGSVLAYFPVVMNIHAILIAGMAAILSVIASLLARFAARILPPFLVAIFISVFLGATFIVFAQGFLYGVSFGLVILAGVLAASVCFLCFAALYRTVPPYWSNAVFIIAISLWLVALGMLPWVIAVIIA